LPALIALSGSVIYALVMITTRMLRQTNDIMLMATYFIGAVAFGVVTVPFGWVAPTVTDVLFLAGVGFSNIVAQFCVIRSLKLASASVVVPYQYTLIVWSVVFGWLMFAELPDAYTVAGAAIIVAAGLYIFWRERVTAKAPVTPPP
jgi:drug/metabolite transporter (DMT)-like permease